MLFLVVLTLPAGAAESIAAHLHSIIHNQGIDVAIAEYHLARRNRNREFSFDEAHLDQLGYRLLREKRGDDAVAIFSLNSEMYPLSPRVRYSLGNAHLRLGDHRTATKHYMHALSLLGRMRSVRRYDPQLEHDIRVQIARIKAYPVLEPLVGVYRTEDGRILSISVTEPNHGDVPPRLRLVEFPSGRTRTLHRKRDLSYFTGPGLGLRSPVEERLDFARKKDSPADSIRIRTATATTTAVRIDVSSEEVSFSNGPVDLEGTLLLPDRKGSFPAAILVHGSGKATRNAPGLGELAHFLVLNGYAVLRYDKRGWGESSMGNTNTALLRQLAGDAVAAYRYLSRRDDVDAERIGFTGFSEGAWVAGIAASAMAADPEFIVLLSGGGIEPWRQELYRVEAELRANGFSDDSIRDALEFMTMKFEVARSGKGWDEFAERMRTSRDEPWYKYASGWPSIEFARMAWVEVLQHQPQDVLRSVRCPVLALLGGKDLITPPDQTAAALRKAFDGERRHLLQVSILPDTNHLMFEAETGSVRFTDELKATKRYAGGYFETFASWLAERPGAPVHVVATSAP